MDPDRVFMLQGHLPFLPLVLQFLASKVLHPFHPIQDLLHPRLNRRPFLFQTSDLSQCPFPETFSFV